MFYSELGGKSPVFIDDTCNLETAMKRLLWGKMLNLGQTCIAPDYILCSSQTQNKIVDLTRSIIKEWFGDSPKDSPDLCRIVSERHFDRLVGLINSSSGKIVHGKYLQGWVKKLTPHVFTTYHVVKGGACQFYCPTLYCLANI